MTKVTLELGCMDSRAKQLLWDSSLSCSINVTAGSHFIVINNVFINMFKLSRRDEEDINN